MFGWWPRLPIDFVFPTIGSNEAPLREASARSVDVYIASVRDQLRSTLWEVAGPIDHGSMLTKTVLRQKNRHCEFETWQPGIVNANTWKGKRKIKDRWDEETWGGHDKLQLMCPPMKWWTNMDGHESSTKTSFFSLHQSWHSLVYGQPSYMGQVYQSHPCKTTSSGGDEERHHKRKMARQSPNDLPVKLPWGWKMGSCSLDHGHLLEHPLRMGEDHR